MYLPTPTFSLLSAISGIMTSVAALVTSTGKCYIEFSFTTGDVKSFRIYLSDGSNGRPRLLDGGPRKPLPDFPFDSSTRARRPQMVRPSKPRTASSASRASSNSTNAKLLKRGKKRLIRACVKAYIGCCCQTYPGGFLAIQTLRSGP